MHSFASARLGASNTRVRWKDKVVGTTQTITRQEEGIAILESSYKGSTYHANSRRQMLCWICGRPGHLWPSCEKRRTKGCALCGSSGHHIRACAQRKSITWHESELILRLPRQEITAQAFVPPPPPILSVTPSHQPMAQICGVATGSSKPPTDVTGGGLLAAPLPLLGAT